MKVIYRYMCSKKVLGNIDSPECCHLTNLTLTHVNPVTVQAITYQVL